MDMNIIGWIVAALFGAIALFLFLSRGPGDQSALQEAQKAKGELDTKLQQARNEASKAKEELKRKAKLLEESKAESKKKARREGKKENRKDNDASLATAASVGDSDEAKKFKKTIQALETQVKTLKSDSKNLVHESEKELREDFAKKLSAEKERATSATKTLKELRESIKRKAEDRPDVPGSELNLAEVPAPVVQELSRYYRKGEEFERLFNMSQGKIQLANDRFQELQKKYFAVCRELAVVAGADSEGDDVKTTKAVENLVGTLDAKSEASGDAKKKRRRRRKKPSDAAANADAPASADASVSDVVKEESKVNEAVVDAAVSDASAEGDKDANATSAS